VCICMYVFFVLLRCHGVHISIHFVYTIQFVFVLLFTKTPVHHLRNGMYSKKQEEKPNVENWNGKIYIFTYFLVFKEVALFERRPNSGEGGYAPSKK